MSEIRIPFRSEDDLIIEVIDAAREALDGVELQVTEQIVYYAMSRGTTRIGGLLAELEADPAPMVAGKKLASVIQRADA